MSLAERLRSMVWKVKRIDTESPYGASNAEEVCAELRTFADYVEGRVVSCLNVQVSPRDDGKQLVWLDEVGLGWTTDKAEVSAARLQECIDKRDGRVMP